MDDPQISIVIPTLGRVYELERCLDSLLVQEYKDFEVIIVVDNPYALEYLFKKYPSLHLKIIQQETSGLTNARNVGLAYAKGRIVSFIDDDVVLSSSWAREVINTFNKSMDIGGVSGPTVIPAEILTNRDIMAFHKRIKNNIFWQIVGTIYNYFVLENKPYAIGKIYKSGGFSLGANYSEVIRLSSEIEVDYLEACNMSFRKDILDKIGGFSLEYKGIGDWSEPDLSFRVKSAGFKLIFNPTIYLEHRVSQKEVFNQRGKDSYQRMLNFIHFYFKWIKPDTLEKVVYFSANLVFINIYWCYKFIQSKNLYWLDGITGTFLGLIREIFR